MILRLSGLTSGYHGGAVVHGVSLHAAPGRIVALIGANGAGKTTLLDTVAGLVPATTGRVHLGDHELTGLSAHRRARLGLGYLPQGARIFSSLTVTEHLTVGRRTAGDWTPARVLELLPELAGRRGQRAASLSGGERQLLALARALLTQPRILLLDEPGEGLAPMVAGRLWSVVTALAGAGIGILLATPQPDLAAAVAGEFTVLVAGRVARQLTAADLRDRPHALTAAVAPLDAR